MRLLPVFYSQLDRQVFTRFSRAVSRCTDAARTPPPPPPPVVTDEVTVTKLFAVSNPGFPEISSSKRDWRMRGSSNRDAKI